MKQLLLFLLLLTSTLSFSQDIVGVWAKNPQSGIALEFKADGAFKLINLDDPTKEVLKNLTVTYELSSLDGVNIVEYFYFSKTALVKKETIKYKIEDGLLLLPRTVEINGVETVQDYRDTYTMIK